MARWPQSGELRDAVRIEIPVRVKSSFGDAQETEDSWETLYDNVPARVRQTGEALIVSDAQVQAKVVWEIVIRYRADIGTDMRVIHRDRRLYFSGVCNLESRNRWLVITAQERADQVAADEG